MELKCPNSVIGTGYTTAPSTRSYEGAVGRRGMTWSSVPRP